MFKNHYNKGYNGTKHDKKSDESNAEGAVSLLSTARLYGKNEYIITWNLGKGKKGMLIK